MMKSKKSSKEAKRSSSGKVDTYALSNDLFSENFPKKSALNTDAMSIPIHYQKCFNLNTNSRQDHIGNSSYLPKQRLSMEHDTNLATPPHINL